MKRILGVLVLCLAGMGAFAADVHWTNVAASSGDFNLPANWDGTFAGNRVTWHSSAGLNLYSVSLTMTANAVAGGWEQDYWNNVVNLDTAGYTLDLSGYNFQVNHSSAGIYGATNRIYGGGTVKSVNGAFGNGYGGANPTLFELSGSTTFEMSYAFLAGNNAAVKVSGGSTMRSVDQYGGNFIGQAGSSLPGVKNADVELSGASTVWYNSGRLIVGNESQDANRGNGTMTIRSGAKYYGGNDQILSGYNWGGKAITNYLTKGTLNIRDSGSLFYATNGLYVGLANTGVVNVTQGGALTVKGSAYLGLGVVDNVNVAGNLTGSNSAAYGSLLADELGVIEVNGTLALGLLGKGEVKSANNGEIYAGMMDVNSGGRVIVSDGYLSSSSTDMAGSLLRLELGAKDHAAYYLDTGSLTLSDVNLEIELLGNFSASLNDEIKLFSYYGGFTGSFNGWSDGTTFTRDVYEFTYNQKDTDAYLTVTAIPEPTSILLLASGLVAAFKLRRRA